MSLLAISFSCIHIVFFLVVFFFFQAEDGIRDTSVTGVQTCALPISLPCARDSPCRRRPASEVGRKWPCSRSAAGREDGSRGDRHVRQRVGAAVRACGEDRKSVV